MDGAKEDVNGFRSTLAQVLATGAISWLCTGIGFTVAMPTIVIGALRTEPSDSPMAMTEEQASWFGSLLFVVEPLSSLVAALCQDLSGRRSCLWLCNLPLMVAWAIIYLSTSTAHLFAAIVLMGASIGFIETPFLAYLGEISQPRLRGVLSSFGGVFYNSGLMLQSFLGATLPWRTMGLCSLAMPISGFIYMGLMPESPAWLLTKGRVREAERSFQWLRGWVSPVAIRQELSELISYIQRTQRVSALTDAGYTAVSTIDDRSLSAEQAERQPQPQPKPRSALGAMMEYEVLVAFRIIFLYFIISNCASLVAMRPFFIEILVDFRCPVRPHSVVAFCGFLQLAGAVSLGLAMRTLGKRGLTFLSLGTCILCCLGLAAYVHWRVDLPWLPVILFCVSYYSATLGIVHLPWILIIELFPLRARGLAGGVTSAFGYVLMFVTTKTYYDVVRCLGLAGGCLLYGTVGLVGMVYLYWDLPETEGYSLLDIERRLSERRPSRRSRTDPPAPPDVQL